MKKSKRSIVILVVVIVIAGGLAFWAFNKNKEATPEPVVATQTDTSKDNINKTSATVIKDDDSFSTFYTVVEKANLLSLLEATEPHTVFVPNNKAFTSLPEGTVDRLLAPESSEQLKGIASYHIIQGSIAKADLVTGKRLPTLNGQELTIQATDSDLYVIDAKGNKAHVVTADKTTSNGVIYEIDAVLLPQ